MLPNICSSISHLKTILKCALRKLGEWLRRCLNVRFEDAKQTLRGSGLRHAHWGKPSHQTWLRFRTLWLKQLLGSKGHIFRSCRVLVPACVPIRDLPGLYPQALFTWFASLIHYSGVGCFSGERTPNSYTFFSTFSLYPCYFGDSFKLIISWLNPILHMRNRITWPIVVFFFIFSILSLYYLKIDLQQPRKFI